MIDLNKIFFNKKIALIGNASSLFEKNYGEDIDKNDLVCRINKGPLVCDTKTNGIRTDVLFYGDPATIADTTPILSDNIIYILTNLKYVHTEQSKKNLHIISYYEFNEFKRIAGYTEKGKWPSTGLSAILFMLKYNASLISLYGFDWKETPTFYKKGLIDFRHDYKLEKTLIHSYGDILRINR